MGLGRGGRGGEGDRPGWVQKDEDGRAGVVLGAGGAEGKWGSGNKLDCEIRRGEVGKVEVRLGGGS